MKVLADRLKSAASIVGPVCRTVTSVGRAPVLWLGFAVACSGLGLAVHTVREFGLPGGVRMGDGSRPFHIRPSRDLRPVVASEIRATDPQPGARRDGNLPTRRRRDPFRPSASVPAVRAGADRRSLSLSRHPRRHADSAHRYPVEASQTGRAWRSLERTRADTGIGTMTVLDRVHHAIKVVT